VKEPKVTTQAQTTLGQTHPTSLHLLLAIIAALWRVPHLPAHLCGVAETALTAIRLSYDRGSCDQHRLSVSMCCSCYALLLLLHPDD